MTSGTKVKERAPPTENDIAVAGLWLQTVPSKIKSLKKNGPK